MSLNSEKIFSGKEDFYTYRPKWSSSFLSAIIKSCNLPSDAKIFDIGTGIGTLSLELAKLGFSIFAIDVNQDMLRKHKKEFKSKINQQINLPGAYTIINSTASSIGLKNKSADLITSANTTHWFRPELNEVISEFKRILKPNGKIAILSHRLDMDANFRDELHRIFDIHCPDYRENVVINLLDGDKAPNPKEDAINFLKEKEMNVFSDVVVQKLAKPEFLSLIKSFSFVPQNYDNSLLMYKIKDFFDKNSVDEKITLKWKAEAYIGPLNWRSLVGHKNNNDSQKSYLRPI